MRAFLISFVLCLFAIPLTAQEVSGADELMSKFSAAHKADDFQAMKSLVEANRKHINLGFFRWETTWCRVKNMKDEGAAKDAEMFFQVLDRLGTMNKLYGSKSDWLVNRLAWLQGLTTEQRAGKVDLWNTLGTAYPKFESTRRKRSEKAINELVPNFESVVEKAAAAGDGYWSANAAWYLAQLHEMIPNWFEVVYWYKKGASFGLTGHAAQQVSNFNLDAGARKAARTGNIREDLVDTELSIADARKKYDEELAKGTANVAGGGDVVVKGDDGKVLEGMPPAPNVHPDGTSMTWEEVKGFKVTGLKKPPTWEVPNFNVGAHWYFWPAVEVDKGESKQVPILPGDTEVENQKGKIFLHPGGKGKGKPMRLKLRGRASVVKFDKIKYLDGSEGKVWHWVMAQPGSWKIMGFSFRSGGTSVVMRFRGASVAKGKVRGQPVEIHDTNGNGAFNDFGLDVIVIGKGRAAEVHALSKYIPIEGRFFELKVEANGRTVRTKPYDGPVAAVKLDWKGNTDPSVLIASGSGTEGTYFYDLMRAKDKPIWVIPGSHQLYQGHIGKGKGEKRETIWIRKGRSGAFNVEPGRLNKWAFGGAGENGWSLTCKTESRREKGKDLIFIEGLSVKVYGNFGEEYAYPMFGRVIPKVEVRKGKGGSVVARGKFRHPELADIRAKNNDQMFHPKDLELKKSFKGDFQVKLSVDYKPLGLLESEWITGN